MITHAQNLRRAELARQEREQEMNYWPRNHVTRSDIAEIWTVVARLREAKGDTAGAHQARVSSAIYSGRRLPKGKRYGKGTERAGHDAAPNGRRSVVRLSTRMCDDTADRGGQGDHVQDQPDLGRS